MTTILEIRELAIAAETARGPVTLVEGLSLAVERGAITALVGESGCGKSMTALAVMGLLPPRVRIVAGEIRLAGRRLDTLSEREYQAVRGRRAAMIFQEPMTSLNPLHTAGAQIAEVLELHGGCSRRAALARAVELLRRVGIPDPEQRARQHPHQMSGGMRQRVMIAMAIAAGPEVVLADEPTTALDVTIQAQILDLLRDLAAPRPREAADAAAPRDEAGAGILLITHDLGVVAQTARRVTVMYAGRDVESGSVEAIFRKPRHPYTRGLLAALPRLDTAGPLAAIPGQVPRPGERAPGCAFAPRCRWVLPECGAAPVPLFTRGDAADPVQVRCLREDLE